MFPTPVAVVIIPARLESTRLPRKMLADLHGEPLILHTWRQACKARHPASVIVATDSTEIADHLTPHGATVIMTDPAATCGTERIAEAARTINADVIVNLQGDEPLIDPDSIDLALQPFFTQTPPDCSTLVLPIPPDDRAQIDDPNQVKVVLDANGYALYFTRAAIPYRRNHLPGTPFYRHIGLYAFKATVLQEIAALPPSPLEEAESLEQLRLLENGYRIRCMLTTSDQPGVNTQEELEQVRQIIHNRHHP